MHIQAMKMAREGVYEYEIVAELFKIAKAKNMEFAYQVICSVRGETLHNESHGNVLQQDQLLLVDAGVESPHHYSSDITRTTPVGGRFTSQQKEIYDLVLNAQLAAIAEIKPGKAYRDIHLLVAQIITQGLKEIGIMKGDTDLAVREGAHALFFPHGLGHMMGLDVHDMEDLGENYVGYSEKLKRSEQFGTAYLRFAKAPEPGYVLTVEPGIYFIPQLIGKWKSDNLHRDFIAYDFLEKYFNFGGVRIEDNILVTPSGNRILGKPIPKTPEEIEQLH
jgi:Xaa-Pro aminopeptidase